MPRTTCSTRSTRWRTSWRGRSSATVTSAAAAARAPGPSRARPLPSGSPRAVARVRVVLPATAASCAPAREVEHVDALRLRGAPAGRVEAGPFGEPRIAPPMLADGAPTREQGVAGEQQRRGRDPPRVCEAHEVPPVGARDLPPDRPAAPEAVGESADGVDESPERRGSHPDQLSRGAGELRDERADRVARTEQLGGDVREVARVHPIFALGDRTGPPVAWRPPVNGDDMGQVQVTKPTVVEPQHQLELV